MAPDRSARKDVAVSHRDSRPLVGRESELQQFRSALAAPAGGAPSVVLVEGEAGIGKSRLIEEALADTSADHSSWRVSRGDGMDLTGGAVPYGLASTILQTLVRQAFEDNEVERRSILAMAPLLPGQVDRTAERMPVDRLRLFATVRQFVRERCQRHPVAMIVDDAQWVDQSSLDLLGHVARSLTDCALLLVVAFRPLTADAASVRTFISEMARLPHAAWLGVSALNEDDVAAQLDHLGFGDSRTSTEHKKRIFALSGGVPLYVEELAAWCEGAALPGRLETILAHRYASCSQAAQHVLAAAAFSLRPFDTTALESVTGLTTTQILSAMREASARGLIDTLEDGSFRFHHVVQQEAIKERVAGPDRALYHRLWAEWFDVLIDAGNASWTSVAAYHWCRAGNISGAFRATVRAAWHAERVGALGEAARHWRGALDLWPKLRAHDLVEQLDRNTLVVALDECLNFTGRWEEARRLLEEEEKRADQDPIKHLWLRFRKEQVFPQVGLDPPPVISVEEAVAVLEEMRRAAETAPSRMLVGCLMMFGDRDLDTPISYMEECVDLLESLAQRASNGWTAALAEWARVRLAERNGDLVSGAHHAASATRLAEVASPGEAHTFRAELVRALTGIGRPADAAREGESVLANDSRDVVSGSEHYLAYYTAIAHMNSGNSSRARELLVKLSRHPSGAERAWVQCALAQLEVITGDLKSAEANLEQAREVNITAQHDLNDELALTEAHILEARGDYAASSAVLEPLLVSTSADSIWLVLVLAARLLEDAAPLSTEKAAIGVSRLPAQGLLAEATQELVLAALAEHAGNDARLGWRSAADAWKRVGNPYHEGWCRLQLAKSLLAHRDRAGARYELQTAADLAGAAGAHPLRQRAGDLSRRARLDIDPGGRNQSHVALLTAREMEVLELLALGKTNREIADALFMSAKTASVHVSRILTKLGASNRTEAAWHLHQFPRREQGA
jgi:DNA-binding CsgD family transcriptional regulator